jgi:hypothetical protein
MLTEQVQVLLLALLLDSKPCHAHPWQTLTVQLAQS